MQITVTSVTLVEKKIETIADEKETALKPVLNDTSYSDDDVWEPSIWKEKTRIPVTKPSRHSTNKKEKAKVRHRPFAALGDHRRQKRITSFIDLVGEKPNR